MCFVTYRARVSSASSQLEVRETHLLHESSEQLLCLTAHNLLSMLCLNLIAFHGGSPLPKVGRHFSNFDVELNVFVLFLSDHESVVEMKVQENYDVVVWWLEESKFDVVIKNFDLLTAA